MVRHGAVIINWICVIDRHDKYVVSRWNLRSGAAVETAGFGVTWLAELALGDVVVIGVKVECKGVPNSGGGGVWRECKARTHDDVVIFGSESGGDEG